MFFCEMFTKNINADYLKSYALCTISILHLPARRYWTIFLTVRPYTQEQGTNNRTENNIHRDGDVWMMNGFEIAFDAEKHDLCKTSGWFTFLYRWISFRTHLSNSHYNTRYSGIQALIVWQFRKFGWDEAAMISRREGKRSRGKIREDVMSYFTTSVVLCQFSLAKL